MSINHFQLIIGLLDSDIFIEIIHLVGVKSFGQGIEMPRSLYLRKIDLGHECEENLDLFLTVRLIDLQSPFTTIDLQEIGGCLHFQASVDIYSCGCSEPSLRCSPRAAQKFLVKDFKYHVTRTELTAFYKLWQEWGNNTLMAGTDRQLAILKENGVESYRDYHEQIRVLTENKLMVDRGFQYGSGWLVKPIPDKVRDKIILFCERNQKLIKRGQLKVR